MEEIEFLKNIFKKGNNIQKFLLLLFVLHFIITPFILFNYEFLGEHYYNERFKSDSGWFLLRGEKIWGSIWTWYGITLWEGVCWMGGNLFLVFSMKLFKTNK